MGGCWTCRIRKKKCNQTMPSCSECLRLGIHCDGYGKRPSWADGGVEEARYRTQLKDHIRRKAKTKRHVSISHVAKLTPPLSEHDDADVHNNDICSNSFVDFFISSPALISEFDAQTNEAVTYRSNSDTSSSHASEHITPTNTTFDEVLAMPEFVGHSFPDAYTIQRSEHQRLPSSAKNLNLRQCEAVMFYLDHLFWNQFPMCDKASFIFDRTWVLSYAVSSSLFRKALTQLSNILTRISSTSNKMNAKHFQDEPDAMHDLRDEIVLLKSNLVSRAQSGTVALLAAASLMTYQILHHNTPSSLNEILSITEDLVHNLSQQIPYAENESIATAALGFSLGQAFYIDTVRAATQRSACILKDFEGPTSRLNVDLNTEETYRCPVWILQTLRSITQLDQWKHNLSLQGRLSVPELVSRCAKLFEHLRSRTMTSRRLSTASTESAGSKDSRSRVLAPDNAFSDISQDTITQLHANAASIYIHVIVSGANPHLQEIQDLVESSLNLLHSLRNLDVFSCLVWPLLITTCLAAGAQRESFRYIITRAIEQEKFGHTFGLVLQVAQECWRMSNEAPLLQWDWKLAMDNLQLSSSAFVLPLQW